MSTQNQDREIQRLITPANIANAARRLAQAQQAAAVVPPPQQYDDDYSGIPLLPSQKLIKNITNQNSDVISFTDTISSQMDLNKIGHYLVIESDTVADLDNKLRKLANIPNAANASSKIYALVYDGVLSSDQKVRIRKAVAIDLKARLAEPAPAPAPAGAKAGSAWLWRVMLLGKGNFYKDQIDYVRSELYAM